MTMTTTQTPTAPNFNACIARAAARRDEALAAERKNRTWDAQCRTTGYVCAVNLLRAAQRDYASPHPIYCGVQVEVAS